MNMKKFLKRSLFLLSAILFAVLFLPELHRKKKDGDGTGGQMTDA